MFSVVLNGEQEQNQCCINVLKG